MLSPKSIPSPHSHLAPAYSFVSIAVRHTVADGPSISPNRPPSTPGNWGDCTSASSTRATPVSHERDAPLTHVDFYEVREVGQQQPTSPLCIDIQSPRQCSRDYAAIMNSAHVDRERDSDEIRIENSDRDIELRGSNTPSDFVDIPIPAEAENIAKVHVIHRDLPSNPSPLFHDDLFGEQAGQSVYSEIADRKSTVVADIDASHHERDLKQSNKRPMRERNLSTTVLISYRDHDYQVSSLAISPSAERSPSSKSLTPMTKVKKAPWYHRLLRTIGFKKSRSCNDLSASTTDRVAITTTSPLDNIDHYSGSPSTPPRALAQSDTLLSLLPHRYSQGVGQTNNEQKGNQEHRRGLQFFQESIDIIPSQTRQDAAVENQVSDHWDTTTDHEASQPTSYNDHSLTEWSLPGQLQPIADMTESNSTSHSSSHMMDLQDALRNL